MNRFDEEPDGDPHGECAAEIARLSVGHRRYEVVRRMNVQAFKDAYNLCIKTGKPFDQIIDELAPFFGVGQ
jgi:hypothetical protein